MKTTTKIVAGAVAALSLAAASAVFAHQGMGPGMGMGTGPGAGPGMGMGYGMGHGMRGGMHGPESVGVTTARLADLKAELKITPAQDSAWQAYATVVQQQATAREAMRAQMQAQMQAPDATAPVDRSARHEAMSKLRDQHFAARSAAVKDLYAVLTPEQKTLAEQRLSVMPGHGMALRAPAK
jgi:LTXXQ motif family protein